MKSKLQVLWIGLAVFGVSALVLIIGGQTNRHDGFEPREVPPLHLPKALISIQMPFADRIEQNTSFLRWDRPEGVYPMISVFAFDPSYDAVSINEVVVVCGTNEIRIAKPVDGSRLAFRPYLDQAAFRETYPTGETRDVFYSLIGSENPLLSQPPLVGTKVTVRAEVEIFAKDKSVCVTNVMISSEVQRKESKTPWLWFVFAKLFMPRF